MHEYSLMQSLLEMISEELKSHPEYRLLAFTIKVGTLSGVEPELLKTAFEILKPGTPAEFAKMNIKYVPLICRCENCLNKYNVEDLNFECPRCKGSKITVLQGDDTILESLELEEIE